MNRNMTMADVIRKVQVMTPRTPYETLLNREFGVIVPPATPMYQKEYLYKYCLQLAATPDVPDDEIVPRAGAKVVELMAKYPWAMTKYEDVVAATAKTKVKREAKPKSFADGTITHNPKNGMYFFWMGNTIASRGNSLEGLKKTIAKKLGNVTINEGIVTI